MDSSFFARYQGGDYSQVWTDLIALGPAVRTPTYFADAYAVACETMRRVRYNVEAIYHRLIHIGYHFAQPTHAFLPPSADITALIADIERLLGPIPLSLRAFYEQVGAVDFSQATAQLIHYWRPERAHASELAVLGEEDPLVVNPIQALHAQAQTRSAQLYFYLASDEFHKADYSGGENYHVWLPNAAADFPIAGMYGIDEYFVAYLRASLQWGGFRGRVETLPDDEERCQKVAPQLGIIEQLAADLMPI